MPKFCRRGIAVLTIAIAVSFSIVQAQEAAGPGVDFRGSKGWTVADGVVTLTGEPSRENFLS